MSEKVRINDYGIYTVLEHDGFSVKDIMSEVYTRVHEKNERLVGSVQVCQAPSSASAYYHYVATMIKPPGQKQHSDW